MLILVSVLQNGHNLAIFGLVPTKATFVIDDLQNLMSSVIFFLNLTESFVCLSVLKVFDGNHDSDTVAYNELSPPIATRFIRLAPVDWHIHISMRVEIYGCPGTSLVIGDAVRSSY